MSNTLLLTKVFLKESLDTRKFKENKKKTLSFGAFVGLMGLLFVGLATIYALTYANMFIQAGVDLIYLFCMFSSISSLLILMTSITRAKGLFISKDYDLLRSMPIRKNEIVTSKLITMYLVELVYAAIIMIPCAIVCSIITGNYSLLALAIPVTLVIPGLPIVIGALAGLLVALFADRSKFGNIISILSYGILIVAIMIFSSTFGQSVGSGMAEGEVPEVFLSMATLNPTLKFVLLGQTENALWHIAFFACNILALIAAITIIASLFDKVYAIVSSSVQTTKYKATTLKTESQFKTLFKNEIKRYFSSKLYCINTLMSGLCSIFMCIMIAISMGE
ncbi:MAG: hypothetical protein MJ236_04870, partial [Clostridia bacterium]|nr:hypothetical protein [Clostridia bacterium]